MRITLEQSRLLEAMPEYCRAGKVQRRVLKSLISHGRWHAGCGWTWDTLSSTRRLMESLCKRNLAVCKTTNGRPIYCPSPRVIDECRLTANG